MKRCEFQFKMPNFEAKIFQDIYPVLLALKDDKDLVMLLEKLCP